jgi:hypothetical protein
MEGGGTVAGGGIDHAVEFGGVLGSEGGGVGRDVSDVGLRIGGFANEVDFFAAFLREDN